MTHIKPRDLARLIDALTRNGSDNPVTNHALVTCTEVIATNLAAIHEQVRIANLIALATIDPDGGGPSEDLTEISREALERLATRRRHTSFGREGVPEEIVTWSLLPDIAAALGIPQKDHS